jgi:protein TonB
VAPRLDPGLSREPEYPPASRRLGEQGSLLLEALIASDGRVLETKLVQSSGSERLDRAALEGVKENYRFIPGTLDGKPQKVWLTVRFAWKLR